MSKIGSALGAVRSAIIPGAKSEAKAVVNQVKESIFEQASSTQSQSQSQAQNSNSNGVKTPEEHQRIMTLRLYLNRLKEDQNRFRQAQQQALQQKQQTQQQEIEDKQRIKQYQFEQKKKTALVGGLGGVEDKKRHHERVGKRF